MINQSVIEETAAEMRIRIESRDERMREDLRENFSGRIWFGVDVVTPRCKHQPFSFI